MPVNAGVMSSASVQWNTPPDLVDDIAEFLGGIFLDPCNDVTNPTHAAVSYCGITSPEDDGLLQPWVGPSSFVNPGYGRTIKLWVAKALTSKVDEVVMLLPARTDTQWFQPLWAYQLCFLRGRLSFSGSKNTAPFPSVLVYKGHRNRQFAHAFMHRGTTVIRQFIAPEVPRVLLQPSSARVAEKAAG